MSIQAVYSSLVHIPFNPTSFNIHVVLFFGPSGRQQWQQERLGHLNELQCSWHTTLLPLRWLSLIMQYSDRRASPGQDATHFLVVSCFRIALDQMMHIRKWALLITQKDPTHRHCPARRRPHLARNRGEPPVDHRLVAGNERSQQVLVEQHGPVKTSGRQQEPEDEGYLDPLANGAPVVCVGKRTLSVSMSSRSDVRSIYHLPTQPSSTGSSKHPRLQHTK